MCLVVQGCSGVFPRPFELVSARGFPEEAHDAIGLAPHSGERGSDGGVGFGAASRGQGFDSVLAEAV